MGAGTQRPDFAEFYRRSRDECLRTVLISVGDQDTAQELAAEAFARACASWRTASRHPAPAAWAVRTAPEPGSNFSGDNVIFRRRDDGRVASVLLVESTFVRLDHLAPPG